MTGTSLVQMSNFILPSSSESVNGKCLLNESVVMLNISSQRHDAWRLKTEMQPSEAWLVKQDVSWKPKIFRWELPCFEIWTSYK
jgi:hypothetical protein